MSDWWQDRDYLPLPGVPERIIMADTTADAAAEEMMRDAGMIRHLHPETQARGLPAPGRRHLSIRPHRK